MSEEMYQDLSFKCFRSLGAAQFSPFPALFKVMSLWGNISSMKTLHIPHAGL